MIDEEHERRQHETELEPKVQTQHTVAPCATSPLSTPLCSAPLLLAMHGGNTRRGIADFAAGHITNLISARKTFCFKCVNAFRSLGDGDGDGGGGGEGVVEAWW